MYAAGNERKSPMSVQKPLLVPQNVCIVKGSIIPLPEKQTHSMHTHFVKPISYCMRDCCLFQHALQINQL